MKKFYGRGTVFLRGYGDAAAEMKATTTALLADKAATDAMDLKYKANASPDDKSIVQAAVTAATKADAAAAAAKDAANQLEMMHATGASSVPPTRFSPATIPVIRQSILAPPVQLPAPSSTAQAYPAGFAPYAYQPEAVGAPIKKGLIPGFFDPKTAASFVQGALVGGGDKSPAPPPTATGMSPLAKVLPIFRSTAILKANQAAQSDQLANDKATVADIAQKKADAAAYDAKMAANKAAMDQNITSQSDAAAKAMAADIAQKNADATAAAAAVHDAQAAADAKAAVDADDNARIAQAAHDAAADAAIATGDTQATGNTDVPLVAWDQVNPDDAIPIVMPDGSTVMAMQSKPSPWLAVGAGAAGGFFLGGPLGALIGAAGGYFIGSRSSASAPASAQALPQAITGSTSPASNYMAEGNDPVWLAQQEILAASTDQHGNPIPPDRLNPQQQAALKIAEDKLTQALTSNSSPGMINGFGYRRRW